jgi:hypothetical protein
MTIVGNKRVSQLVELTSDEIQPNDLFLIIDATARESKNIKVSELEIYLQGSGSIVTNAISSSYVPGSGVDGPVLLANSSSTSLYAVVAGFAKSASYATTASFALNGGNNSSSGSASASYLVYTGSPNGTASYSMRTLFSDVASTANFLSYFGGNNGTASYAMTTQTILRTKNADTASYFLNGPGSSVATASYAFVAEVANSGNSTSSSFLVYSTNNGTASYAMSAQKFANVITDQGIFLANTQSNIEAQLDGVDILWSTTGVARTPIQAAGTIKIPFTSSAVTSGTVYLSAIDRNTGFETILDSTPITFNLSPSMGTYGNNDSGSIRQTFNLMGQASLYGSYLIFVSASNNLQIESTRTVRFNIASETDTFSVYAAMPITFSVYPSQSLFTYSSVDGPLFTDISSQIAATESLGRAVYTLNGINNGSVTINFLWKLGHLTASNFSNNISLMTLSGIPNSLQYLSCSYCNLSSFYDFESSSLNVFDCNNNIVTKLPNFPYSMSYIDCSSNNLTSLNLPVSLSYLNCSINNITSLLDPMPAGMTTLLANTNLIPTLPLSIPQTITTMSLNNNPLTNIGNLPTQSLYLSFNYCPLTSLPTLPQGVTQLYVQSCSLFQSSVDNITTQLADYSVISGTLDLRGNGTLSVTSVSNIAVLNANGWTTFYDV